MPTIVSSTVRGRIVRSHRISDDVTKAGDGEARSTYTYTALNIYQREMAGFDAVLRH